MPLRHAYSLLRVPETAPALAAAQLTALKLQVPLLYVILTINSGALAYTHFGVAPTGLVVVPVLLLGTVCLARTWTWTRLDLAALPPDRYAPLLRQTNRLCALLGPAFLAWSLALAQYGDEIAHFHVFFYVAITTIACVFCLMHLRSAALIVAVCVIVPFVGFALVQQQAILKAIAVNQLLVGGVMVFILFVYYRDFTRLVGQNEKLEALGAENLRLAATDMLTGLPNRRSFFPALDAAIRCTEAGGDGFTLAIIDLDGFKGVNDSHGHVAGDRVLEEVAERLNAVVPRGSTLARLGGDEFALIIVHRGRDDDLEVQCRSIIAAVSRPFACDGLNARIGASIGCARYVEAGTTAAQLVERADFALYEAKAHHRGTWVMFAHEHETRMRLQGAIEHALRHADLAAELSLVFQPMVDVGQQRTVAFEALARWHSPELGLVSPDRFIPVAERVGLINELTQILMAKALRVMAEWPAHVGLSFNLSMADITAPEAVGRLCALIEASGVDPSRLQLEATETAMIDDFAQAQAGLARVKALGVSLSLDDFGTGYSSLAYVHRLPVDKLKIDRSFTQGLMEHDSARKIIRSILELSRSLKLDCVVEGVETHEQAALLQALGCRTMQGYLFHRPMAPEAIGPYLRREDVGTSALDDTRLSRRRAQ
ncbi:EAL domain-containing protein [Methylobacterium sp. J-088]|uniref:putative bifunctional diguanylate cyclase/phosphodiesterase n=1 Tax=Methylobacterium sp. J-088 TaxID=2836664 RepID=UPI001FBB1DA0|nr:EAL domain-containing protein [Methylobacterium sp. J-088]MCJ2062770.1 EAL domain-containing protein [Methylobacterium sp. J-088]